MGSSVIDDDEVTCRWDSLWVCARACHAVAAARELRQAAVNRQLWSTVEDSRVCAVLQHCHAAMTAAPARVPSTFCSLHAAWAVLPKRESFAASSPI
jgi:hypothetical protein